MTGISMRKSKKTRIKCSETHFGSAALPSCQLEISPFQAKKIVFGTVHKVWGHIFNVPKCTLRDDLIPSAAAFFNSIQRVSSETICTQWKCFKNCDLHYRRFSQWNAQEGRKHSSSPWPPAPRGRSRPGFLRLRNAQEETTLSVSPLGEQNFQRAWSGKPVVGHTLLLFAFL